MNRRSFLKTLSATALIPLVSFLPKKDNITPIKTSILTKPDQFDLLGEQRGIARELLMYNELPNPNYYSRYDVNNNDTFSIAYHHSNTLQELNESNYEIQMGQTDAGKLMVPTGRYIVPFDTTAKYVRSRSLFNLEDREDILFLKLTNTVSYKHKQKIDNKTSIMTVLSAGFATLEVQDLIVTSVVMNPQTYREHFHDLGECIMDELTKYEIQTNIEYFKNYTKPRFNSETGLVGHIWTANIRLSNLIPVNQILLTPSPEYLGVLPVRVPQYYHPETNTFISEQGMAIVNNKLVTIIEIG